MYAYILILSAFFLVHVLCACVFLAVMNQRQNGRFYSTHCPRVTRRRKKPSSLPSASCVRCGCVWRECVHPNIGAGVEIRRARTTESEDLEEVKETAKGDEDGERKQEKVKEKDKGETTEVSKLAFLPSVGKGFADFSSAAPLSFSSVVTDSAPLTFSIASEPSFKIDFSSPTPFGSLFGSTGAVEGETSAPSLTSTGFNLFSSSSASSSSSSSSEFAFSIGGSSSLLFSVQRVFASSAFLSAVRVSIFPALAQCLLVYIRAPKTHNRVRYRRRVRPHAIHFLWTVLLTPSVCVL